MTLLSITEAANAVGVVRGTIYHKLKTGELSATSNRQGERRIDISELIRVFGELTPSKRIDDDLNVKRQPGPANDVSIASIDAIKNDNEWFKRDNARLQQEVERLREDLRRERESHRQERESLMKRAEEWANKWLAVRGGNQIEDKRKASPVSTSLVKTQKKGRVATQQSKKKKK